MFIWCLECIVCVETLLSLKRQICMSGGHIEVIKTFWPLPLLAGLTYVYIPGPVAGAAPGCLQTCRRPWPATAPSSRGRRVRKVEKGRRFRSRIMLEGRWRTTSHVEEDCGEVGSAAGALDLCLNIRDGKWL